MVHYICLILERIIGSSDHQHAHLSSIVFGSRSYIREALTEAMLCNRSLAFIMIIMIIRLLY